MQVSCMHGPWAAVRVRDPVTRGGARVPDLCGGVGLSTFFYLPLFHRCVFFDLFPSIKLKSLHRPQENVFSPVPVTLRELQFSVFTYLCVGIWSN